MNKINDLVILAHKNAVNKGFWDKPRETGTLLALIGSEVTEALDFDSWENFREELADICIRIFDLCGGLEIDLEEAIDRTTPSAYVIQSIEEMYNLVIKDYPGDFEPIDLYKSLSYALEHDRKGRRIEFAEQMAVVFRLVFRWAVEHGQDIEPAMLEKMEKNKERPRLHGKAY